MSERKLAATEISPSEYKEGLGLRMSTSEIITGQIFYFNALHEEGKHLQFPTEPIEIAASGLLVVIEAHTYGTNGYKSRSTIRIDADFMYVRGPSSAVIEGYFVGTELDGWGGFRGAVI